MIKKFNQLRGKVPDKIVQYVSVNKIDHKSTAKLKKQLQMLHKNNTDALCVAINHSSGGQLVQAELMGAMLQRKAAELEMPLVTYVEDQAFMSGFHLLMHGDVHLANPCSMLGNIGLRITPLMMKHFVEDYDVKIRYIHKGENKVRLNRFEEFKATDKEWILNIMQKRVDVVVNHAMAAIEKRK
jgi:ClpP class serine protease